MNTFILCLVFLTHFQSLVSVDIEKLGCWRDSKKSRALESMEHTHQLLGDPYKKRHNAVTKCAKIATDLGYTVFGVQNGGQCFSGSNADKRYDVYGPSNLCKGGKGGKWSNSVYSTKTSYSRSVHKPTDPSPWDAYCSRDLDIVVLLDGSGSTNKKNKARFIEMKKFISKFQKGFDDHARIGVIEYGSDPAIVVDMFKSEKTEQVTEKLKLLSMHGGKRTVNDGLKRAWREQLKESNRSAADKVVMVLTSGDVPYGLYGSSQFLSDHGVRVIAIGVDKNVHYEFLQSIASYRDVSNIFSVNSEQLQDVAPFIYRDVCNTMPEYVSETTTTTTTTTPSPPTTDAASNKTTNGTPAMNATDPGNIHASAENITFPDATPANSTTAANNSTMTNATSSAGNRQAIPNTSDFPSAADVEGTRRTEMPEFELDKKSPETEKKKNVVTAVKNGASKEELAPMTLVNPSPELNLFLTDAEANEINNRDSQASSGNETLGNVFDGLDNTSSDGSNVTANQNVLSDTQGSNKFKNAMESGSNNADNTSPYSMGDNTNADNTVYSNSNGDNLAFSSSDPYGDNTDKSTYNIMPNAPTGNDNQASFSVNAGNAAPISNEWVKVFSSEDKEKASNDKEEASYGKEKASYGKEEASNDKEKANNGKGETSNGKIQSGNQEKESDEGNASNNKSDKNNDKEALTDNHQKNPVVAKANAIKIKQQQRTKSPSENFGKAYPFMINTQNKNKKLMTKPYNQMQSFSAKQKALSAIDTASHNKDMSLDSKLNPGTLLTDTFNPETQPNLKRNDTNDVTGRQDSTNLLKTPLKKFVSQNVQTFKDPSKPQNKFSTPVDAKTFDKTDNIKGSDSKIAGPGIVDQTVELHQGNGKEHVSEHPQRHIDYNELFAGKLSNRLKDRPRDHEVKHLSSSFDQRGDIQAENKAPSSPYNTTLINSASKELAQIYSRVHNIETLTEANPISTQNLGGSGAKVGTPVFVMGQNDKGNTPARSATASGATALRHELAALGTSEKRFRNVNVEDGSSALQSPNQHISKGSIQTISNQILSETNSLMKDLNTFHQHIKSLNSSELTEKKNKLSSHGRRVPGVESMQSLVGAVEQVAKDATFLENEEDTQMNNNQPPNTNAFGDYDYAISNDAQTRKALEEKRTEIDQLLKVLDEQERQKQDEHASNRYDITPAIETVESRELKEAFKQINSRIHYLDEKDDRKHRNTESPTTSYIQLPTPNENVVDSFVQPVTGRINIGGHNIPFVSEQIPLVFVNRDAQKNRQKLARKKFERNQHISVDEGIIPFYLPTTLNQNKNGRTKKKSLKFKAIIIDPTPAINYLPLQNGKELNVRAKNNAIVNLSSAKRPTKSNTFKPSKIPIKNKQHMVTNKVKSSSRLSDNIKTSAVTMKLNKNGKQGKLGRIKTSALRIKVDADEPKRNKMSTKNTSNDDKSNSNKGNASPSHQENEKNIPAKLNNASAGNITKNTKKTEKNVPQVEEKGSQTTQENVNKTDAEKRNPTIPALQKSPDPYSLVSLYPEPSRPLINPKTASALVLPSSTQVSTQRTNVDQRYSTPHQTAKTIPLIATNGPSIWSSIAKTNMIKKFISTDDTNNPLAEYVSGEHVTDGDGLTYDHQNQETSDADAETDAGFKQSNIPTLVEDESDSVSSKRILDKPFEPDQPPEMVMKPALGSIKPIMNKPPKPLLKPHHPKDFDSLFEHARKDNIHKDLQLRKGFGKQINGEKKTLPVSLAWLRQEINKLHEVGEAWTDSTFAPKVGEPLAQSNNKMFTRPKQQNESKMAETLGKILLAANAGDDKLKRVSNVYDDPENEYVALENRLKKMEHMLDDHEKSEKLTKSFFKELTELHNEMLKTKHKKQSTSVKKMHPVVTEDDGVENSPGYNTNTVQNTASQEFEAIKGVPLTKPEVTNDNTALNQVAKESNGDEAAEAKHKIRMKGHRRKRKKNFDAAKKKHIIDTNKENLEFLQHIDDDPETSSKELLNSKLGKEIISDDEVLGQNKDQVLNFHGYQKSSPQLEQYSFDPSDPAVSKAFIQTTQSKQFASDQPLTESDFPKRFSVNDFKLSDLPSLPDGKSYALSNPSQGSVLVKIRDDKSGDVDVQSQKGNSDEESAQTKTEVVAENIGSEHRNTPTYEVAREDQPENTGETEAFQEQSDEPIYQHAQKMTSGMLQSDSPVNNIEHDTDDVISKNEETYEPVVMQVRKTKKKLKPVFIEDASSFKMSSAMPQTVPSEDVKHTVKDELLNMVHNVIKENSHESKNFLKNMKNRTEKPILTKSFSQSDMNKKTPNNDSELLDLINKIQSLNKEIAHVSNSSSAQDLSSDKTTEKDKALLKDIMEFKTGQNSTVLNFKSQDSKNNTLAVGNQNKAASIVNTDTKDQRTSTKSSSSAPNGRINNTTDADEVKNQDAASSETSHIDNYKNITTQRFDFSALPNSKEDMVVISDKIEQLLSNSSDPIKSNSSVMRNVTTPSLSGVKNETTVDDASPSADDRENNRTLNSSLATESHINNDTPTITPGNVTPGNVTRSINENNNTVNELPTNISATKSLAQSNDNSTLDVDEHSMSSLEYTLGCTKPLRVLFAIDVSDGLGAGPTRRKRWNRLKQFIKNINRDVIRGVRHKYMVYNVEPRYLTDLDSCDKETEYFMTADDCLCGKKDNILANSNGCSVNSPTQTENLDDWGINGPRTGYALEKARKKIFNDHLHRYKNVIFLITHKESMDSLIKPENNLKQDGISLVNIELGDRHDLRKRAHIERPHDRRKRGSDTDNTEDHKMKVSLKKLQSALKNIVSQVCTAKTDDEITKRSRISQRLDFL